MLIRHLVLYGVLSLLFSCTASRLGRTQQIDTKNWKQDDRLKKTVTLAAHQIYLHELLSRISKKMGVNLSVDTRDNISGISLSIYLKDTTIADVMSSLWSLLSYRDAPLQWQFDPDEKMRHYRLVSTARSRELANRLNHEVQKAFEDQAELMIRMAFMTPDERRRNIAKLSRAMIEDNDEVAKEYLSNTIASERGWMGLRLFADTLPVEQRLKVLRGQMIEVPFHQLNPAGKNFIISDIATGKVYRNTPEGKIQITLPQPDSVSFSLSQGVGRNKTLSPKLMIGPKSSYGTLSFSYSGIMDAGLRRRSHVDWILSGDQRTSTLEAQQISSDQATAISRAEKASSVEPSLDSILMLSQGSEWIPAFNRRLMQCAQAVPLSYIAVLPKEQPTQLEEPAGKTVQQYMELLAGNPHFLMHKWRDTILLVNYANWFYGHDESVPFRIIDQLRSDALAHNGYLLPETIANAILALNPTQIEHMVKEYPVLLEAKNWPPIQLCKTFPNVFSEQGILLRENVMATLQRLKIFEGPLNAPYVAVRLRQENVEINKQTRRLLFLQFRSRSGHWNNETMMELKPANIKSPPPGKPPLKQ